MIGSWGRNAEFWRKPVNGAKLEKMLYQLLPKDVLDTEMQKCQQDTNSLLLVPRKHHRKRELVDSAAERFGESYGNLDGTVRIVALSHIHQSWESAYRTKIEIVKAIFTASKR